ncbi:hypothetical protein GF337_11175 [candidate division KSB1 bacterium]|nr:hypothetical protein [candidate division KSB1 bacterium]
MGTKLTKLIILLMLSGSNLGWSAENQVRFISPDTSRLDRQRLTWMTPSAYRPAIMLNGEWEYRIKESDQWQIVSIPSFTEFKGNISYRKTFAVDSSFQNRKFKLVCYGINYYCTIFINKKFIGSHAGDNSFFVELPQNSIQPGKSNIIEINLNTSLDARQSLPLKNQILGLKNYGGIYRDIYLLAIPNISAEINDYKVSIATDQQSAKLSLNFDIRTLLPEYDSNKSVTTRRMRCYLELWKPGGRWSEYRENIPLPERLQPIHSFETEFEIEDPLLWEPESPFLYDLSIYLFDGRNMIDSTGISLGVKEVRLENEALFLNGKKIVLNGINYYNNLFGDSNVPKLTDMDQTIVLLKHLNAQAVRVVGSPLHPYWTELCDRNGILLFQEIPLNRTPVALLQKEQFGTLVSDYLSEVVQRDKLHVSVSGWGLGGPFGENSSDMLESFYEDVITLDHKPCYQLKSIHVENTPVKAEIIFLDLSDIDKRIIARRANKWLSEIEKELIFVSVGSSFQESRYPNEDITILEEIQAANIVETWKILRQFEEVDGLFINSLADWQANYPLNSFGPREKSDIYPSGLIEFSGQERLAYNVVRSLFLQAKTRINPGLSLEEEHPSVFPLVGVITLLIFLFIYNTRRYIQENLRRIFIHPHGFFVDIRDKRKVPVSHTILVALLNSLGLALITATLLYYYRENLFFDHLLTLLTINQSTKESLISFIWDPATTIAISTIIFIIAFIVLGMLIKIFAIIFRKKLPFKQSIMLSFWSGTHFMVLIPIGMILYRIIIMKPMFFFIAGLIFLFCIWHIARLTKAIKVVYYWSSFRAAVFILFCILTLTAGILYYYQQNYALLDYLELYANHLISY